MIALRVSSLPEKRDSQEMLSHLAHLSVRTVAANAALQGCTWREWDDALHIVAKESAAHWNVWPSLQTSKGLGRPTPCSSTCSLRAAAGCLEGLWDPREVQGGMLHRA